MIDDDKLRFLARELVGITGVVNASVDIDCGHSERRDVHYGYDTEIGIDYSTHCRLVVVRTTPPSHGEHDEVDIRLVNLVPSLKNKRTDDDVLNLDDVNSKTQKLILEMFKIVDESYDDWLFPF